MTVAGLDTGSSVEAGLVALFGFGVAAAILALAVAAGGLRPLAYTALVTALLAGEAAIEMRQAPPRGGAQRAFPFRTNGSA